MSPFFCHITFPFTLVIHLYFFGWIIAYSDIIYSLTSSGTGIVNKSGKTGRHSFFYQRSYSIIHCFVSPSMTLMGNTIFSWRFLYKWAYIIQFTWSAGLSFMLLKALTHISSFMILIVYSLSFFLFFIYKMHIFSITLFARLSIKFLCFSIYVWCHPCLREDCLKYLVNNPFMGEPDMTLELLV